jgi:hypothetical protein
MEEDGKGGQGEERGGRKTGRDQGIREGKGEQERVKDGKGETREESAEDSPPAGQSTGPDFFRSQTDCLSSLPGLKTAT